MADPGGPYWQYQNGATFERKCPKGHIVKPDPVVCFHGEDEQPVEPNATCFKCGRVAMNWLGYF